MEITEKAIAAKVKVIKEESCKISFSVELPKEEVIKETEEAFQNIQSRASLPGFRAGKAPMDLVRKHFAERARQHVMEHLIGRAATQVIRERKLRTIDTPKIEKLDFDFGKPLQFQMTVERDPEIKLKDYKGLKVTRPAVLVTDENINKVLEDLRERNASLNASKDAQVGKTHFVVVDFEGKIEGKAFPGGSATNHLLDMNQPQTIAGFSEGLLGAAINEKRAVTVTFPADYFRKEWAGKQAVFDVTIKEIKEKKLPTLDNEFAKDLGTGSLEELRQKVRENLTKEQTAKSDKDVEDQIHQGLIDNHKFDIPPTLVVERVQTLTQRALSHLQRQGLVQAGDKQAEATILEKSRPQAERDIRLSYLLRAISVQEKLEATEADVQELKKKALAENKDQSESIEKYFQERDLSIRASLTEGKVLEFLKNNAKVKTAKD
ncbi:MAG: trigger factor [Elusimicrobiota bacterium]|jgi:trigger factor